MDRRHIGAMMAAGLTLLAGMMLPGGDVRRSLAAPPDAAGTPAPQTRSPLAPGPIADLNLVFTAQAIGWIEPCG
ncbi:MAG TPA: hypothetical protein VFG08_00960 [Candidatus Polarisedimenticolia bacterium]|nr:hypothetical protein [Candidatus Polarisedimenticolia bacterium]